MQIHRHNSSTGRSSTVLKVLISLLVVVGISFSLAWVWHTSQPSIQTQTPEPLPVEVSQPQSTPESSLIASSSSQSESSAESSEEPESSEDEQPSESSVFTGAVPQSEAVDPSYFDDAIFFGDSISTGIPLYHIADNAATVASTGINTDNINYKKAIDVGLEERVTILEAAQQYGERSKVYIMLGGNGIGFDKPVFIEGYRTFVKSVKAQYPGATIYLQSMTPVVDGYKNEFDPTMNNQKIDDYNLEIMALAQQEGIYYLDVASALKDESGNLPLDASPVDGLHFSPEYYVKWFEYLKTHTIKKE